MRVLFFFLLFSCSSVHYRMGAERIEWAEDLQFAQEFFGTSIHFERVRLFSSGDNDMNGCNYTVGNTIYFNPSIDYANNRTQYRSTLIHELMHVWGNQQYSWDAFPDSDYQYEIFSIDHITELGKEEQAALIQDYYEWIYEGNLNPLRCTDCQGMAQSEYLIKAEKLYQQIGE